MKGRVDNLQQYMRGFPPPCRGCFDFKPERLNEPFFAPDLRPLVRRVVIVTLQGSYDRFYRCPVRIVGNGVLHSGAIRVIVVRGGPWADG